MPRRRFRCHFPVVQTLRRGQDFLQGFLLGRCQAVIHFRQLHRFFRGQDFRQGVPQLGMLRHELVDRSVLGQERKVRRQTEGYPSPVLPCPRASKTKLNGYRVNSCRFGEAPFPCSQYGHETRPSRRKLGRCFCLKAVG